MIIQVLAALVALPTFKQKVTTEWPDAKAAEAATAEVVMLGEGERFVFSGRWDDRNTRSLAVAKALSPLGFRSTFYVNGRSSPDYAKILREEVALGNSIGCHTISHDYMSRLLPVKSFREILENRIELEIDSQSPVVTLGMPYGQGGAGSSAAGFDNIRVVGEAASNAGLLGGAEGNGHSGERFGLAPDDWVGSFVFRANDQKPDLALFTKGLAEGTNLVARGKLPGGPHVTLGVHPWQKDEGLVDLAAMVKDAIAAPGTVLMDENQYVAYRLQALRATVEKVKTEGKRAVFQIVRPHPYAIGAAVPLNLKLSDGRLLRVDPPKVLDVPAEYARLDGALSVSDDDTTFTLAFTNTGKDAMKHVSFTLRLPPGYRPGVIEQKVKSIAPGETVRPVFEAKVPENPLFREGTLYAAVEINVPGKRIWAPVAKKRGGGAKIPYPRDNALFSGPWLLSEAPAADALQAMSVPGAKLVGEWLPCDGSPEDDAAWAVTGYRKGDGYRVKKLAGWNPAPPGKELGYALAFDFTADTAAHGEEWDFVFEGGHVTAKNLTGWLNGERHDGKLTGRHRLRNGANRLVVLLSAIDANMYQTVLSVRSAKDASPAVFVGSSHP